MSNCWRDLLWNSLLTTDTTCDEDARKLRNKKSIEAESSQQILAIKEWQRIHFIDDLKKKVNQNSIVSLHFILIFLFKDKHSYF